MAAHLVQDDHRAGRIHLGVLCRELTGQRPQQGHVLALARLTQARRRHRAHLDVGHTVTHAFAARLVVQPEHRHARALQDVQQTLKALMTGHVVRAAQVRKHARHRGLCVGAARSHLREIHQVPLGLQRLELRRSVALIPAQPEIGRPRGLTHHQHNQRRRTCTACRQDDVRVSTHNLQHLLRAFDLAHRVPPDRVSRVVGVDHVAQRLVVAHQGSQVLKAQGECRSSHQKSQECPQCLAPQQLPCRHPAQRLTPPPNPGHSHAQQQRQPQSGREQVADLAHIGARHIGHHAGVNHDTIGDHEIAAGRHRGQQQHAGWLEPARPHQKGQRGKKKAGQCQREAQHPQHGAGAL